MQRFQGRAWLAVGCEPEKQGFITPNIYWILREGIEMEMTSEENEIIDSSIRYFSNENDLMPSTDVATAAFKYAAVFYTSRNIETGDSWKIYETLIEKLAVLVDIQINA